jgi:hypothetical protein
MMVALTDPNQEVWLDAEASADGWEFQNAIFAGIAENAQVSKKGKLFNVKEIVIARNGISI